ncbi:hypothetical protein ANO11243_092050 [Dothideomycetidae sp. 11243]|nr:hypothetical protein ANO11243_092050 [fungal sp. No.11243]
MEGRASASQLVRSIDAPPKAAAGKYRAAILECLKVRAVVLRYDCLCVNLISAGWTPKSLLSWLELRYDARIGKYGESILASSDQCLERFEEFSLSSRVESRTMLSVLSKQERRWIGSGLSVSDIIDNYHNKCWDNGVHPS